MTRRRKRRLPAVLAAAMTATVVLVVAEAQMNQEPQSLPAREPATQPASGPASPQKPQPAAAARDRNWRKMPAPVVDGPFVRPAASAIARPIWGHAQGLRVGLEPMPGPRGLLRVYAPHLGHDEGRMINFIAIEPMVAGKRARGFSELEKSRLDGVNGLRFWSADRPDDPTPRLPEDNPSQGRVSRQGQVQVLDVYVLIERFRNGARPYLQLTFRSDLPHEVGIAAFAAEDSKPLSHCIVTATMGNFARLRLLHLAGKTASAADIWPEYREDGFAPHKSFGAAELLRTPEGVIVAATTDEANPQQVKEGLPPPGWRYYGQAATQYWRRDSPQAELIAQVNGRFTYWLSRIPIPGGIAFENFELVEPFQDGGQFWFGVTPQTPAELGFHAATAPATPAEH